MLAEKQCTLREADSTLCEWKAAHHAACVGDLAGEAFEVQDGTRDWSAKGCTDFWKELNWGLQGFRKANTKLELYPMQTVERQAARLRAERVEAAWGLQERIWRSPREAKMGSSGGPEGVEAGPSEA